jgi:CubicO group peptidase (beta-lactamase class C family)
MGDSCLLLDGPVRAQRASSYWYDDNRVVNNTPFVSMTWPQAAGALGSTLEDLAKWDQGLRSHTLLSASTSELTHHPARLNNGEEYPYGFGIGLGSYLGCRCTHHAGGIAGFVSQIRSLYDPNLTVILLANYRTAPFDRNTRKIARLALGVADVTREPLAAHRDDLDALSGIYVAQDNQTVYVKREGENLVVTWAQGQNRQLIHFDKGAFFEVDDSGVEWRFEHGRLQHTAPSWPPNVYSRLTDL